MSEVPLVRPRVISQTTAEQLLLEDVLEPILERADAGAICIFGAPGSGKSCALKALAGRLPKRTIIELLDNPDRARVADLAERMIVIYAAETPHELPHLAKFTLASWGEDEALEYLMAAHKDLCKSVMPRIRGGEPLDLPELWTICLDRMAEDESIPDVDAALRRHLDRVLTPQLRKRARSISFRKTVDQAAEGVDEVQLWGNKGFLGFLTVQGLASTDVRLIREPRIRRILAAEQLVDPDDGSISLGGLKSRLPTALIQMAGRILAKHPLEIGTLEAAIRPDTSLQAMGASLLHAAGAGWRPPDEGKIHFFMHAHLPAAPWAGLKLDHLQVHGAELTGINLQGARLGWADLERAILRHAVLSEAKIDRAHATFADLDQADLRRVSAVRSNFAGANCRGADFEGAALQGARFLGADLTKASFRRADLRGVYFQLNLEGDDWINSFARIEEAMEEFRKKGKPVDDAETSRRTLFDGTDFTGADLQGACLQHSDLRTARLSGALLTTANLMGSNLEGVTIAGACLDQARLQGAVLTGSVLTGASMRGAFLRHAKLADIDWERADLRDADLRKVTFHLGSSRSGLVFGEPSEGTRSGFYTDEFHEQSYRSPEEIRVANLRGADLRGAVLRDTDFYLVDLREALYTSEQEAYLRRCGAILETRVG